MIFSVDTEDVDRLAQDLADLTGETVEEALIKALNERLDRLRASGMSDDARDRFEHANSVFAERVLDRVRSWDIDRTPVTAREWIEAGGDAVDSARLGAEQAE
jgi:antitoxin VapB